MISTWKELKHEVSNLEVVLLMRTGPKPLRADAEVTLRGRNSLIVTKY